MPQEDGDDPYLDVPSLWEEKEDRGAKHHHVKIGEVTAAVGKSTSPGKVVVPSWDTPEVKPQTPSFGRSGLTAEQWGDASIQPAFSQELSGDEIAPIGSYMESGVLLRKWKTPEAPADECGQVLEQIVVPSSPQQEVLSVAHEGPAAGGLGIGKTLDGVQRHSHWPSTEQDEVRSCKFSMPEQDGEEFYLGVPSLWNETGEQDVKHPTGQIEEGYGQVSVPLSYQPEVPSVAPGDLASEDLVILGSNLEVAITEEIPVEDWEKPRILATDDDDPGGTSLSPPDTLLKHLREMPSLSKRGL
jgi:hypothetical protein